MKILLVTSPHLDHGVFQRLLDDSPSPKGFCHAQTFVPIGLFSLAGSIPSYADVRVLDINKAINSGIIPLSANFYSGAASWLNSFGADMIGFMTECDSYHHVLRICKALKRSNRQVHTILGGVHASMTHQETIHNFPEIDFILRGEGELAFPSLVGALCGEGELEAVGNLTYRKKTRIINNSTLPLIENLDKLPWPNFSDFQFDSEDTLWIETGRGCPFQCTFCVTAPYWNRKHRVKSPERIIKELSYFKEFFGRNKVNFVHDLFTTDRRWVLDFCKKLVQSELEINWTCSSRTDTIDEEQIYWMHQSGCRNIYFGIESGTQERQVEINKNLDLNQSETIIKKTIDAGIDVTVGFISGLPGESEKSFKALLDYALRILQIPGTVVHLFFYGAYRGSISYDQICSQLISDHNFIDFPLPKKIFQENIEIMARYRDIFTRHTRLESYNGLSFDTIKASEEFFPLINTLRDVFLALDLGGDGLFKLLNNWSKWIAERNHQKKFYSAYPFHGTTRLFLVFLKEYLEEHGKTNNTILDLLRWEDRKNEFRLNGKLAKIIVADRNRAEYLFTNPTAEFESFEHLNEGKFRKENTGVDFFAFYFRVDGTPAIARVSPIAKIVLEISEKGLPLNSIADIVLNFCHEDAKNKQQLRKGIIELVSNLTSNNLLVYPVN